jgi:hypothetical protein
MSGCGRGWGDAVKAERERMAEIVWTLMNCSTSNVETIEVMNLLDKIKYHQPYWEDNCQSKIGIRNKAVQDLQALTITPNTPQV